MRRCSSHGHYNVDVLADCVSLLVEQKNFIFAQDGVKGRRKVGTSSSVFLPLQAAARSPWTMPCKVNYYSSFLIISLPLPHRRKFPPMINLSRVPRVPSNDVIRTPSLQCASVNKIGLQGIRDCLVAAGLGRGLISPTTKTETYPS